MKNLKLLMVIFVVGNAFTVLMLLVLNKLDMLVPMGLWVNANIVIAYLGSLPWQR